MKLYSSAQAHPEGRGLVFCFRSFDIVIPERWKQIIFKAYRLLRRPHIYLFFRLWDYDIVGLCDLEAKAVTFVGDYAQIIGSRKPLFLQECTTALANVHCSDVTSGSIIVTLQGQSGAIAAAITQLSNSELKLPSFTAVTMQAMSPFCCLFSILFSDWLQNASYFATSTKRHIYIYIYNLCIYKDVYI